MVDPGVLISALIAPDGATAAVLDLIEAELVTVVVSPRLLDELAEVLHRDKFDRYLEPSQAEQFVGELRDRFEIATDPDQVPSVSRDPDALVSGDADLTSLDLTDIAILSPRAFIDRLAGEH